MYRFVFFVYVAEPAVFKPQLRWCIQIFSSTFSVSPNSGALKRQRIGLSHEIIITLQYFIH